MWGNCPITCNILVEILLRVLQRAGWRLQWTGWRLKWLRWRRMELGRARWRWVRGLVIPICFFIYDISISIPLLKYKRIWYNFYLLWKIWQRKFDFLIFYYKVVPVTLLDTILCFFNTSKDQLEKKFKKKTKKSQNVCRVQLELVKKTWEFQKHPPWGALKN